MKLTGVTENCVSAENRVSRSVTTDKLIRLSDWSKTKQLIHKF